MSKAATLNELSSRQLNGAGLRIGICYTQWNKEIVNSLVSGCEAELQQQGVAQVVLMAVPGAYELPYAASRMIKAHGVDCVICIGCLIKGETLHFEYISEAVTHGIMRLGLDSGVPVLFGVLTCLTEAHARARAGLEADSHNHGIEWAQSAVEMASLRHSTKKCILRAVKCCPYMTLATAAAVTSVAVLAAIVTSCRRH